MARKIFDRAGVAREDRAPDAETQIAALFACRLLLPTRWFRDDVRRLGLDLPRLHARYSTASMECVAWRLLDLDDLTTVTLFDNNHVVDRRSNVSLGTRTLEPTTAELAAQAYCHAYSRPRLEHSPGLTAWAWPLHRADWRREIVVSVLDSEFFEIHGGEP